MDVEKREGRKELGVDEGKLYKLYSEHIHKQMNIFSIKV